MKRAIMPTAKFRVDQIDHVEVFVPDRHETAKWYESILGLEIVKPFKDWAEAGGPLMISSNNGGTMLALFEGQPQGQQQPIGIRRIAFRVSGQGFLQFLDRLQAVPVFDAERQQLTSQDVVDQHRRQLDKLDLARCYARLRDLEVRMPDDQRHAYSRGNVRDVLAKRIGGGSGRNLERYLRILKCPQEIQQAFQDGRISLVDAGKIAGLAADVQSEIGAAIRSGQNAKAVVRDHFKRQAGSSVQKSGLIQQAAEVDRILCRMKQEVGDGALGLQTCAWLTSAKQKIEELLEQKGEMPADPQAA